MVPSQFEKLGRKRVGELIAAMPDGPDKNRAAQLALKIFGESPKAKSQAALRKFSKYRFDPDGYIRTFFEWEPWAGLDEDHPGQREIFQFIVLVVRQQIEKRQFENGQVQEKDLKFWKPGQVIQNWIRVESGNGIGKTKMLSGFVNWFTDCFSSIVYTFHTSARQDELTTWKEVNADRRGRGMPGRALKTKIDIDPDRFAISRPTSNARGKGEEKLKGQHNEYLGLCVDEADGVEDQVFTSISTIESGGISVVIMTANPRSRSSMFHRLKKHSYVKTFRISSLYHPNVVQGKDVIPGAVRRDFVEKEIETKCSVVHTHSNECKKLPKAEYDELHKLNEEKFQFALPYDVRPGGVLCPAGTIFEPQPEFMWTVLGIAPPTSLDKTVIPVGTYEAATKRIPEGGDITRARMGVDCARSGKDYGTVYVNWQDVAYRSCELFHQTTASYVDAIKTEALKLKEKGVTSLHIRVDAGYGSGVIDGLTDDAELKEAFEDYQVFEVHFGSKAYNTKDYDNLITELYYEAAETLKGICIHQPPESLEIDLTEREYRFINRAGKTKKILEPKEDFIKRLGRSPDDGDGLVLAIGPDQCFNKATVEIISSTPAAPSVNRTTVADDLMRKLGVAKPSPERVLIIGWPNTGKTTLAAQMGGGRSTDEVKDMDWSEASEAVSKWFDAPGPWIIEGVAIPRALRKWKEANPGKAAPVDRIIRLVAPHVKLSTGQTVMGKGMDTVLAEIMPWLRQTVKIEER